MAFYTEDTLRNKANRIGFQIEKGFQHDEDGDPIKTATGRITGYQVKNLEDGSYVWGSRIEGGADHLWTLDDVENFLRDEYNNRGLQFTMNNKEDTKMAVYSESTLRKKAREIGWSIKKDTIKDGSSCYPVYWLIDDENHIEMLRQSSLGEVEDCLHKAYEELGLKW